MMRSFTGWHMTGLLCALFGVVIAVNVTMARFAVSSFGGTVVENSYVASQKFDGWLAEARAQAAAGWRADVQALPGHRLAVSLQRGGALVPDARIAIVARHPLGRVPPARITLRWDAATRRYVAAQPIATGRWLLEIAGRRGAERLRFEQEIRA